MTYDEIKQVVLDLLPEEDSLYMRTVDQQLLRVRYVLAGVVIVTYGYEDIGPSDDVTPFQRYYFHEWIDAVTKHALRRASDADVR